MPLRKENPCSGWNLRGAGTALCFVWVLLATCGQPVAGTTTTTSTTTITDTRDAAARAQDLAAIRVCQMQLRYIQQMTEEFLQVAYPMDAALNKAALVTNIHLYESSLDDLTNGNASRQLVAPTQQSIQLYLAETRTVWLAFKKLLQDNVNTVTRTSTAMLTELSTQSEAIRIKTEGLFESYVGLAMVSGVAETAAKTYARRAALTFDTMRKQSFFVALNVKKTQYLNNMVITHISLKEIRDSLLLGNQVAGVPEVDQLCVLMPFYPLDRALTAYTAEFDEVQQTRIIGSVLLGKMVVEARIVSKQLTAIIDLFDHDDKSCDATAPIDDDGWFNLVVQSNTQAMLTQRASRIFFQLSRGLEVTPKAIAAIMQDLTDVQKTTRKLFKGSYTENIPTPPTQKIIDALALSRESVIKYEEDIATALELKSFGAEIVGPLAIIKDIVWNRLSFIADYYVDAAIAANPLLRSVIWGVSRRQPALYCKSTSEALLVSLNVNAKFRLGVWQDTTGMWEQAHWQLLRGRNNGWAAVDPEAIYKSMAIPRSTHACTLTTMAEVIRRFRQLMALHSQLIASNPAMDGRRLAAHASNASNASQGSQIDNSDTLDLSGLLLTSATNLNSEQVLLVATQRIDTVSLHATNAALQAVTYFRFGTGTCDKDAIGPLGVFMGHIFDTTAIQWEVSLQYSGNLPFTLQKAMTEYYLLASGHAQKWLNASHNTLQAHRGFIAEEAAAPMLVDALQEFKRTWDTYKETDEERALGLRVAYITANQYPLGQKDRLDIADGPEEYHTVHLKYHPHYRKILYDRNYYDIFMFDLTGNLIYSVYKELDYATNFRAKGNGVWKDSGLGEAFEAAIASPDTITVIDWKPYGPSHGAQASFLSTGVRQRDGRLVGVFSTQLPPDSKPFDSLAMLSQAIRDMDQLMMSFKFGEDFQGQVIVPPPNQGISDKLFILGDEWYNVRRTLSSSLSWAGVADLVSKSAALLGASEGFLKAYADSAAAAFPKLESSRIVMVSAQRLLVTSMCSQAVLIGMEGLASTTHGSRAVLAAEMLQFESRHAKLVDGIDSTTGRRLTGISGTILAGLLEGVYGAFSPLKTTLKSIADGGAASIAVLFEVVTKTEALASETEKLYNALATTTRTTTLMTLELLAPMPFSGDWSAGSTMKVSSLLAQGIINEQQKILPGYNLVSEFMDDKCDPVVSSQLVLGEMARKDTYIALGGAGCSAVCESVSFLAQTQNLPFLSYECPAASLSNTLTYPTISRFGTVTTAAIDVIKVIGNNYSWPQITVITGDPTKYGIEADYMQSQFIARGFTANIESARESEWVQIKDMMNRLKVSTKGADRIYWLVGTEDYFRKVICASIVSEAELGIVWLSRGAFTDKWWTKTDTLAGLHRKWLVEDATGDQLKVVLTEFKAAWDVYTNRTADHRRIALAGLYATAAKENLDVAICGNQECPEAYHAVHKRWHPTYRQILYDRDYYDIFIFDLEGDCIYSVYKESDFATNFKLDGTGQWRNSGLGDAFRMGVENPDNVSYIDWKPYGPSAGALAAFLSTGIKGFRGTDEENTVIGVYTIQLPPHYQRSIEQVEEKCTLESITNSYEGAINIVGLGRPTDDKMVSPLPCFEGHSPQSFSALLDLHLLSGYPLGDRTTMVESPHGPIKFHPADAVCVLAFTVRHLLDAGHTIEEIQKPDTALYNKFVQHIKTQMDFQGASGQVKLIGNDRPNYLVVQQVRQGSQVDVGLVNPISDQTKTEDAIENINWINAGPDGSVWKKEAADPEKTDDFPYWTIQVFVPTILLCVPTTAGVINGWRSGKQEAGNLASATAKKA